MLKRTITAGTAEKSDVRLTVSPGSGTREIFLDKLPHPRFSAHVEAVITEILDQEQIQSVRVHAEDFGALDFVLRARLRAALREAGKEAG